MKGFERAAGLLQKRISAAGESRGFAVSKVLTHWDEIAGPEMAALTRPVKIGYASHGLGATLTVLCSGANAPMIEMQKETLRQRVNACYGYNAVARIALTQTAPQGFAEAQALFQGRPASTAQRNTPDPETEALAREASAPIRDEALRAALEDMGRTILSRPKPKGPTR
ncbi:DUF721 domain-containing protein [Frigidibacter sp. ROC022]|uniref:DUF721 domain-containing protein n=1 Tax=Frigidibacter sp. ROC022 TaxID=2971796 RepID=UPI003FCCA2C6